MFEAVDRSVRPLATLVAICVFALGTLVSAEQAFAGPITLLQRMSARHSGTVNSRFAYLAVKAKDSELSPLSYTWSIVSGPAGHLARFSSNGSESNINHVFFERPGIYTVSVKISNPSGDSVTDEMTLRVNSVYTDFKAFSNGRQADAGFKPISVLTQSAPLELRTRDQFRREMPSPAAPTFTFFEKPIGSSPTVQTSDFNQATVNFDSPGMYQLSTTIAGKTTTSAFSVSSQASKVEAVIDGVKLTTNTTNVVRTLTPTINAQRVDQFGRPHQSQAPFRWLLDGADKTSAASGSSISILLGSHTASTLTISSGAVSTTYQIIYTPPCVVLSSRAQLLSALKAAIGGEVFCLSSGVEYGEISLYKPRPYMSEVTVRSEFASQPAKIAWLSLSGVTNVRFDSVRFDAAGTDRSPVVSVSHGSSNISIVNSEVTAGHDPYTEPKRRMSGVSIRDSENITFQSNHVYRVASGLGILKASNVTVSGNLFEETLLDGINIASNCTDIVIADNTLYAQKAKLYPDHHYDLIQSWVEKDATQDTTNLKILRNTLLSTGDNPVKPQSIFMRADYVNRDGTPNPFQYDNVEIAYNVIQGQHVHGISVTQANNLNVHHNTVMYGGADPRSVSSNVQIPQISVKEGTNTDVFANIMPNRPTTTNEQADYRENFRYNPRTSDLARFLANPFAAYPMRASFASLPLEELKRSDGTYAGAFTEQPSQSTTAQFTYQYKVIAGRVVVEFDASPSLAGAGADLNQAQYLWTFADGTTGTGRTFQRYFENVEPQTVTLRITEPSGRTSTMSKEKLTFVNTTMLDINFDQGFKDSVSGMDNWYIGSNPTFEPRAGGNFTTLGGAYGLLYIPPTDQNFQILAQTNQLSMSFMFRAFADENAKHIPFLSRHGQANITLNPDGRSLTVAANGRRALIQLPSSITTGEWFALLITLKDGVVTLSVDGTQVGQASIPPADLAQFFTPSAYGFAIGASGPWPQNSVQIKFSMDNLVLKNIAAE